MEKSSKKDTKTNETKQKPEINMTTTNLIIETTSKSTSPQSPVPLATSKLASNDDGSKMSKKTKRQDENNNVVLSNSQSQPQNITQTTANTNMTNGLINTNQEQGNQLKVEIDQHQQQNQHPSPLSSKSGTINMQTPRAPILSASDATHQTASFVRGVSVFK